jgi:hypothetical protein
VELSAYEEEQRYDLTVGSARCTTPCSLGLPPGVWNVQARGAGSVSVDLAVSNTPGHVRLHHHGPGFKAGAALIPLGLLVASSMWALSVTCTYDAAPGCVTAHLAVWPVLGFGMVAAGITLMVLGRHPKDSNRLLTPEKDARPRLELRTFGLSPARGGATGTLVLTF